MSWLPILTIYQWVPHLSIVCTVYWLFLFQDSLSSRNHCCVNVIALHTVLFDSYSMTCLLSSLNWSPPNVFVKYICYLLFRIGVFYGNYFVSISWNGGILMEYVWFLATFLAPSRSLLARGGGDTFSNFFNNSIRVITSRRDCDRATCLLSVVDRTIYISIYRLDHQRMREDGMVYPVLDITDVGSLLHSLFQSPADIYIPLPL